MAAGRRPPFLVGWAYVRLLAILLNIATLSTVGAALSRASYNPTKLDIAAPAISVSFNLIDLYVIFRGKKPITTNAALGWMMDLIPAVLFFAFMGLVTTGNTDSLDWRGKGAYVEGREGNLFRISGRMAGALGGIHAIFGVLDLTFLYGWPNLRPRKEESQTMPDGEELSSSKI